MEKPNTMLIDVRDREDYEECHLDGAQNMPYEMLELYKESLSKKKTYILYCERGATSLMAARELDRYGFSVCTVIGGIQAIEELDREKD